MFEKQLSTPSASGKEGARTKRFKDVAMAATTFAMLATFSTGRVLAGGPPDVYQVYNEFFFASHIVEVRCEGPVGVVASNCVAITPQGSKSSEPYRVPQGMYLIITSMEWYGGNVGPDGNYIAGIVSAGGPGVPTGVVRVAWFVPAKDRASHLYPTSGIVLPPNFQPNACYVGTSGWDKDFVSGCVDPGGRMVLRGYLSPY